MTKVWLTRADGVIQRYNLKQGHPHYFKLIKSYVQADGPEERHRISYLIHQYEKKYQFRPFLAWIFEEGEVYGTTQEIMGERPFRSFTRKLGKLVRVVYYPYDPRNLGRYHIPYKYYPDSRRVRSFEYRKAIKNALPKGHKTLYSFARGSTKKDFISKVAGTKDEEILKSLGYKDAGAFWRACRNIGYQWPKSK